MRLLNNHGSRVTFSLRKKTRRDPNHTTKRILIGYYLVAYDPLRKPNRIERSLGTKNPRAAHRMLQQIENHCRAGKLDLWNKNANLPGGQRPQTCQEAAKAFLDYKEHRIGPKGAPIRKTTLRSYRSVFRTLVRFLEQHRYPGMLVQDIVKRDVEDFILKRKISSATREGQFHLVREFLDWCVDHGLIYQNPVKDLKVKRAEGRITFLTEEDEARLFEAMENHARTYRGPHSEEGIRSLIMATRIGINAGLRLGEILRLEWKHIEFDTDQPGINVVSTPEQPTKNGKSRRVPIARDGRLYADLVSLKAKALPGDDRVLVGPKGRTLLPNYISSYFKKFVERAGLPDDLVFHSTRHTFGTRMAAAGTPLPILARLMGHLKIQTTMRYIHVTCRDGIQYINQTFGKLYQMVMGRRAA